MSASIIEKLPQDIKLIINRKIEMDIWDHTKVLDLISLELRARETCVVPNQLSLSTDGKNEVVMICSRVHPYMWQEPLGAHVGQTLSNMCFVKVSIGRINVG